MKASIESKLAEVLTANLTVLTAALPQYAVTTLPDTGSVVVVTAEIEHRAGPLHLADVTFELSTVRDDDPDTERSHREHEQALRIVAAAVVSLDCGLGVTVSGPPFYQGQSGGIDDNRWVSSIKYRWGVTAV